MAIIKVDGGVVVSGADSATRKDTLISFSSPSQSATGQSIANTTPITETDNRATSQGATQISQSTPQTGSVGQSTSYWVELGETPKVGQPTSGTAYLAQGQSPTWNVDASGSVSSPQARVIIRGLQSGSGSVSQAKEVLTGSPTGIVVAQNKDYVKSIQQNLAQGYSMNLTTGQYERPVGYGIKQGQQKGMITKPILDYDTASNIISSALTPREENQPFMQLKGDSIFYTPGTPQSVKDSINEALARQGFSTSKNEEGRLHIEPYKVLEKTEPIIYGTGHFTDIDNIISSQTEVIKGTSDKVIGTGIFKDIDTIPIKQPKTEGGVTNLQGVYSNFELKKSKAEESNTIQKIVKTPEELGKGIVPISFPHNRSLFGVELDAGSYMPPLQKDKQLKYESKVTIVGIAGENKSTEIKTSGTDILNPLDIISDEKNLKEKFMSRTTNVIEKLNKRYETLLTQSGLSKEAVKGLESEGLKITEFRDVGGKTEFKLESEDKEGNKTSQYFATLTVTDIEGNTKIKYIPTSSPEFYAKNEAEKAKSKEPEYDPTKQAWFKNVPLYGEFENWVLEPFANRFSASTTKEAVVEGTRTLLEVTSPIIPVIEGVVNVFSKGPELREKYIEPGIRGQIDIMNKQTIDEATYNVGGQAIKYGAEKTGINVGETKNVTEVLSPEEQYILGGIKYFSVAVPSLFVSSAFETYARLNIGKDVVAMGGEAVAKGIVPTTIKYGAGTIENLGRPIQLVDVAFHPLAKTVGVPETTVAAIDIGLRYTAGTAVAIATAEELTHPARQDRPFVQGLAETTQFIVAPGSMNRQSYEDILLSSTLVNIPYYAGKSATAAFTKPGTKTEKVAEGLYKLANVGAFGYLTWQYANEGRKEPDFGYGLKKAFIVTAAQDVYLESKSTDTLFEESKFYKGLQEFKAEQLGEAPTFNKQPPLREKFPDTDAGQTKYEEKVKKYGESVKSFEKTKEKYSENIQNYLNKWVSVGISESEVKESKTPSSYSVKSEPSDVRFKPEEIILSKLSKEVTYSENIGDLKWTTSKDFITLQGTRVTPKVETISYGPKKGIVYSDMMSRLSPDKGLVEQTTIYNKPIGSRVPGIEEYHIGAKVSIKESEDEFANIREPTKRPVGDIQSHVIDIKFNEDLSKVISDKTDFSKTEIKVDTTVTSKVTPNESPFDFIFKLSPNDVPYKKDFMEPDSKIELKDDIRPDEKTDARQDVNPKIDIFNPGIIGGLIGWQDKGGGGGAISMASSSLGSPKGAAGDLLFGYLYEQVPRGKTIKQSRQMSKSRSKMIKRHVESEETTSNPLDWI